MPPVPPTVERRPPPHQDTRFGPLFTKDEAEDEDEELDQDDEDRVNQED